MLHFISKSKLIQIVVHALFLRGKEAGRSVTCFTIGNKYEKYPRPCFFISKLVLAVSYTQSSLCCKKQPARHQMKLYTNLPFWLSKLFNEYLSRDIILVSNFCPSLKKNQKTKSHLQILTTIIVEGIIIQTAV